MPLSALLWCRHPPRGVLALDLDWAFWALAALLRAVAARPAVLVLPVHADLGLQGCVVRATRHGNRGDGQT